MVLQIATSGHGWSGSRMAAALCVTLGFNPRDFTCKKPARSIVARPASECGNCPIVQFTQPPGLAALAALLGSPRCHPDSGNCPAILTLLPTPTPYPCFSGIFQRRDEQDYTLIMTEAGGLRSQTWTLVTLRPEVQQLQMS